MESIRGIQSSRVTDYVAVGWMGALSNVFSIGMLVAYLAYKHQFAQCTCGLIDS